MPAVASAIHPALEHGQYERLLRSEEIELAPVGAGRSARLTTALCALIGIAAIHRRALCGGIGQAARGEGETPAAAPVGTDEGRERRAFLTREAHDLAAAAAEAGALPQHLCFGFRL